MAGLINWKKVAIPSSNPDSDHLYVGIDIVDCFLYIKDDAGVVTKYVTSANVAASIAAALTNYDLSTVVDTKISTAINDLINGAGAALDTLNELAAALGNDPNFATTVSNALALKANSADLGDLALLDTVGNAQIDDNSVSANKIQNNAVTSVKINNNVVTNSKLTDMPAQTIKGNDTGATGDPKDLTVAEVKTLLAIDQIDNTSDVNKPVSTAQATAIASAVTAHEALPDPHPQYLTPAEGNAAYQPLDGDLTAVAALAGAGFAVRTTTNTWATRSIVAGAGVGVTNSDGVFGSPTVSNTDRGSTAVTAHEAAADPHPNYETTTELNARDTANRDRANHTGTQNSSTISNFASTVLATVLSGLSVGTVQVIAATDTVLQALGYLQAQINAKVFGNSYQGFEDTVVSITTSGAQPLTVVASSFTTSALVAGDYKVCVQYAWTSNSGTSDARFALFIDGSIVGRQHNQELQDVTTEEIDQFFETITLGAGTHTIELRFGAEGGSTTTVNRVTADIWRVL